MLSSYQAMSLLFTRLVHLTHSWEPVLDGFLLSNDRRRKVYLFLNDDTRRWMMRNSALEAR